MRSDIRGIAEKYCRETFRLPYVLSKEQFGEETRQRASSDCSSKARKYLKERWGVDFDSLELNLCGVVLPRQLARLDAEALMGFAIARELGVPFGILELTLDCWMPAPYKDSFISQYVWDVDNAIVLRETVPKPEPYTSLDELRNARGDLMADSFRQEAGRIPQVSYVRDLSPFYSKIVLMNLKSSGQKIGQLFVKEGRLLIPQTFYGGKYGKYSLEDIEKLALEGKVRPSASWNYSEFYLLLPGILCPELAYAVSPFEFDSGKIPEIARLAFKAVESISDFCPLCVPFPPINAFNDLLRLKSKLGKYPEYAVLRTPTPLGLLPDLSGCADLWELAFRVMYALEDAVKSAKVRY
ncbi:MAG: hypothetical protein AABW86_01730 [Candidatus Micrarchaeota archaeon]